MRDTRKRYSAAFKARVAVEAAKQTRTLAELSGAFPSHRKTMAIPSAPRPRMRLRATIPSSSHGISLQSYPRAVVSRVGSLCRAFPGWFAKEGRLGS
jgi:hypothetical protein